MHAVLYNYILYNYNNYIIVAEVINVIITIYTQVFIHYTCTRTFIRITSAISFYLYNYTNTYSHKTVRYQLGYQGILF